MNVIWLTDAEEKYYNTIDYLASNFSANTALALKSEVDKCVNFLKVGFQIGTFSQHHNYYRCTIKKYNILIYKKTGDYITISDFVSARTDHSFYDA